MRLILGFWFLLISICSVTAHAAPEITTSSLIADSLHDSIPTAFAPAPLTEEDFSVEWDSASIPGVQFEFEKNSVQWSRASELIVLPRARLTIQASDLDAGVVKYSNFELKMPQGSKSWKTHLLVALVSGPENIIELKFIRQGQLLSGKLKIRFHPRAGTPAQSVFLDSSCSRFRLGIETGGLSSAQWIYLGCRLIVEKTDEHQSATLELYVFRDGFPFQKLRGPASDHQITLGEAGNELKVNYRLPENFHLGSLGLGLGPYANSYTDGGLSSHSGVAPVLTLYGSYVFSEGVRAVAFDATTINANTFSDLGVYLNFENGHFLDRRLIMSLLIGGHAIAFQNLGSTYLKFGAPQGIELTYIDFLKRGFNATTGAFIYPSISGTQYYNAWLRWGSGLFAEINYIDWKVPIQESTVSSRSVGLSIGFPIASFF